MSDPTPPSPNTAVRYVVLRHEGVSEPHFDLMFETFPGSPLATWRASQWPLETGTPLTPLGDHRPDYLTYEGPLSGDRGTVRRVAAGHHHVIQDHAVLLIVELEGQQTTLRLFRGPPTVAQVLRA
jgi:hypothetical protein